MIAFLYSLGACLTLYSFYKTKNFSRLLFLPLLATSFIALQPFFSSLPFFLRFIIFLVALVSLLGILYFLREDYRQAQLDYRRQARKTRQEKMFHVEHSDDERQTSKKIIIQWAGQDAKNKDSIEKNTPKGENTRIDSEKIGLEEENLKNKTSSPPKELENKNEAIDKE